MTVFRIKQHDTEPVMPIIIKKADGSPVDVTGWTLYLHARKVGKKRPTIMGQVSVTNATGAANQNHPAGQVGHYAFQPGDTAETGEYELEVEAHKPGGAKQTTLGFARLVIEDDIADSPLQPTMPGSVATVSETTKDTSNSTLGPLPVGSIVTAFLDDEPRASTVVAANGSSPTGPWSLALGIGATYRLKAVKPGNPVWERTVRV